jgi:PAS domain S-box-containing protein
VNLRFRLFAEWTVIALAATAVIMLALQWRGTAAFDHLFYDQLNSLARPAADPDILIVAIDDASLAELGKWPLPRQYHAELIDRLSLAKPRSVLLDIILSEASDDDQALATTLTKGTPVYVPVHFATPGIDGRAYDTILPVPSVAQSAAGLGHVNVEFDSDGRVRSAALCFQPEKGGQQWPHVIELVARGSQMPAPAKSGPRDCDQTVLIPYAERGAFSTISYAEMLRNGIPDDLIKGRDVIIGATAVGLGDAYPAPYSDGGLLSGAEIMANMLSALKRDAFIRPVPTWLVTILSILPTLLLLLAFLRLSPRIALLLSVGAVVTVLLGCAVALGFRYWMPPGAAVIGIFLVYPLWGWRRLQAMSAFMARELGELESEGEVLPALPNRTVTDDIVGRQSAQLAVAIDRMRDLRRFVSDTIDNMPDPLIVTDLDGRIVRTNDILESRLGSSLVGLRLTKILDQAVIPAHKRQVEQYLKQAMNAVTKEIAEAESRFVRFISTRDDSFVMRTADIRTDAGELRGHIHYFTDITDLARAEEDREVALQLLSHDMRAPQSAIIALLPDLANKTAGQRIERHARRTIQLAQDFVDIARMGESEFEGTDILLPDLLRDVADNFWPLAKERGVTINVIDNSNDAFVFAEPDSLSRAISNLVDNAIKYSPSGGTIHVIVNREITASGNLIAVCIDDEGEGIDPAVAPRLFERFASKRSDKSRIKGIGLGLTFVRAVADRHQGSVSASNRPDGGARFSLTLPEAPDLTENASNAPD